ncbi:MAG: hypothetical protein EOL88_04185 [Bacteroidia bacterium]|nr:hypothetical protein [Bacteroidales bacterium]NCD41271.1 hypothetical protein [Bacteroidia bacterium]
MKKGIFILVLLTGISTIQITAQEKPAYNPNQIRTLAGNQNISNGFYAGLKFGYTPIEHTDAFVTGVRLAWVINHRLALGIAGSTYFSGYDQYNELPDDNFYLAGGQAGLYLEPIFFATSPIHFSLPITLGAGGIYAWNETWGSELDPPYSYHDDWDIYFVVEPGIELDINVVRFMRLSFGATYRLTDDIAINGLNVPIGKGALRNFSGYFAIKFGKF